MHRRFQHIHVDIVGPLPVSRGARYIFTMVDRFTRWPEAVPLIDTSTESCTRALIANWIARFGLPTDITSDRGAQFTSGLWTALAQLLGTQLHHTTAYHPQSNGLVERFHRHLKSALMARLRGPNWSDELPWVLLDIRTAPKEDLGISSAEMVHGAPLTVPGEFVPEARGSEETPAAVLTRLRDRVGTLAPVPTSSHGPTPSFTPKDLRDYSIFEQILNSSKPELEEARTILNNIINRNLYKCIGQTQAEEGKTIKREEIANLKAEVVTALPSERDVKLEAKDLIVNVIPMNYGMKEKNPINNVRFYCKNDPDKAFKIRREQVSQILPERFSEQLIQAYCKKTDEESVRAARRLFAQWCTTRKLPKPRDHDDIDPASMLEPAQE
ncbi:uncharacterized protein [Hemitrygon akajei]|uniref:uncharacterized protein isoform X2 n=1 Tax=Hemitrygon akajei TaxID=2704970 RepID=UPI003BF9F040